MFIACHHGTKRVLSVVSAGKVGVVGFPQIEFSLLLSRLCRLLVKEGNPFLVKSTVLFSSQALYHLRRKTAVCVCVCVCIPNTCSS